MWLSARTCAGENLPNSGGRSESSGSSGPFIHAVATTDGYAHDNYLNRSSRACLKCARALLLLAAPAFLQHHMTWRRLTIRIWNVHNVS
jgi:hypothetical protein